MESWGPGGPPTALLLCSRVTVLAGALVSHVLTHGGRLSTPALASPDTTHTPCLHSACRMTTRRCPPYPVSEDTAFPPDVPELWGEEQRGRVRTGPEQGRAWVGEAWSLGWRAVCGCEQ